jgi:hypothetical protein
LKDEINNPKNIYGEALKKIQYSMNDLSNKGREEVAKAAAGQGAAVSNWYNKTPLPQETMGTPKIDAPIIGEEKASKNDLERLGKQAQEMKSPDFQKALKEKQDEAEVAKGATALIAQTSNFPLKSLLFGGPFTPNDTLHKEMVAAAQKDPKVAEILKRAAKGEVAEWGSQDARYVFDAIGSPIANLIIAGDNLATKITPSIGDGINAAGDMLAPRPAPGSSQGSAANTYRSPIINQTQTPLSTPTNLGDAHEIGQSRAGRAVGVNQGNAVTPTDIGAGANKSEKGGV